MRRVYIARHGQNEDNVNHILNGHRDLPLTTLGEQQAHQLADGILEAGLTFDIVYTSPLCRARRTAEMVCERLGLPGPATLDALIERDFGVMTGESIDDIERLCSPDILKTSLITYFLKPAGGETFPDTLRRAERVLDQVRVEQPDGDVLLVTHGDIGKMVYASFYGLPWQEVLTDFHFGNCELLLLAEGADPTKPHVVQIPQHNH